MLWTNHQKSCAILCITILEFVQLILNATLSTDSMFWYSLKKDRFLFKDTRYLERSIHMF